MSLRFLRKVTAGSLKQFPSFVYWLSSQNKVLAYTGARSLFTRVGLRMLDIGFPNCYWLGFGFSKQNKPKNKAQFKYRFHFHPNHQSLQRVRWKVQVWLNRSVNQNSVYGPYIARLIPVHTLAKQTKLSVTFFHTSESRGSSTTLEVIWFRQITVTNDS